MTNRAKLEKLDAMLLWYGLTPVGESVVLDHIANIIGYTAHGSGITSSGYPNVVVKRSMKYVVSIVQLEYHLKWERMSFWERRMILRKHKTKNAWTASHIKAEREYWTNMVDHAMKGI